jgi:hypothetical protein
MKTRTMQLVVPILLATGAAAFAQANNDGDNRFRAVARMSSFNEVPSIATGARGLFRATLNDDGTVLSFELSWSGLSGAPAVAHVHLGQFFANGMVSFFLCGGGGQPACPPERSGMIRGTVTAANVMAVPSQGLEAGNLRQILDAMRRGLTYANIHTPPQFAGGEARGQISVRGEGDNNDGEE